jgi:hypothetical protein
VVLRAIDEDYRIWWTMAPIEADTENGIQHETSPIEQTETPNGIRHETLSKNRTRAPKLARHKTRGCKEPGTTNGTRHESSATAVPIQTAARRNTGFVGTGMSLRTRGPRRDLHARPCEGAAALMHEDEGILQHPTRV